MKTVIKPEYQSTWFAIPKVLVEGYMPTIGINALALYTILASSENKNGYITDSLIKIRDRSGMRSMKVIFTLDYLKRMHLVNDIIINDNRALELAFKPQPTKKKFQPAKKRTTNDND